MGINVNCLNPSYDFLIDGVSYPGNPRSNTVLYVTKKVEDLLLNLKDTEECLIFYEESIVLPEGIDDKNCLIASDNPQYDYALFVSRIEDEKIAEESRLQYMLTEGGFYIGDNVSIGDKAYIEPGCLIGHNVKIGNNARILAGTIIKKCCAGDNLFCNENAVIGANAYTMAIDGDGNKFRIPSLGDVRLGNDVEIGVHCTIEGGSTGTTVIEDFVKLDAYVHIGHDARIGKNSEITSMCIVGGYTDVGSNSFMGLNSLLRNRISLGENSLVGMGAAVTKNVEANTVVAGVPAKRIR